jgi:hypothetical protein
MYIHISIYKNTQPPPTPRGKKRRKKDLTLYVISVQVDFHVPATGMSVSNIISESAGGDSSSGQPELFLTFTFDFPHPEITDPNSDEARKQREKYLGLGRQVVPHSVEVARKMKVEGRLEKLT